MLGRIGDMILFTPFIEILKSKFPNSEIDVICSSHNYPIIENNPKINKIIKYTKKLWNYFSIISKLISQKYDIYIDSKDHYSTESYIFSRIVRAKTKIGFAKENHNNFHYKISKSSPIAKKHFSLKTMQPFEYLDIEIPKNPPKPILYENLNSKYDVSNFITTLPAKSIKVHINISASKTIRMWSNENWLKIANKFKDNANIVFIVTCEPIHLHLAEQLISKNVYHFASRNISDIISLIKECDIVISPDTSIVHIASAYNKPIIALYTNKDQNYTSFAPLSDIQYSVFPTNGRGNINDIQAEAVIHHFQELLNILQDAHN